MAENVRLLDPHKLDRNKQNPRLIFREDELLALQESIKNQGILVPLTVFRNVQKYTLLDGERRWRCALKLGLKKVPVIVQPKPDKLQNIMMMFAIHKARSDWDPLPTAMKLQEMENVLARRLGRRPTEEALAAAASLARGEVRRYRKILRLPEHFKQELMEELEKPRNEQTLTVDHVLETTKGSEALRKRDVINTREENTLNRKILEKFRTKVIKNTVAPRKLARLARAVERKEISAGVARKVVERLITDANYTIDDAFEDSVAQVDFEHTIEQLMARIEAQLQEHMERRFRPTGSFRDSVVRLTSILRKFLREST